MFASLNDALGFAQRTRKNLELVKMAHDIRDGNYDFHLVTHLMNSLLGLAVVPRVKHVEDEFWRASLQDLVARGWPEWNIPLDKPGKGRSKTKTLGRLTTHLRNAAAHGRFQFTEDADSRELHQVRVIVEDAPGTNRDVNWRAEISGQELYRFCIRLARYIEESLG